MLSVYFGTDTSAVRKAALTYVDEEVSKGATLTTLSAAEYQENIIKDAIGAVSLFGGVELFLFDTPSEDSAFEAEVLSALQLMAESTNIFVVIEEGLLAAAKKQYQKHAADFLEFKAEAVSRFNTFAAADALAQKDKKSLWVLLQQARQAAISPEELIGTLWWQLKTLQLAARTNSAASAGLKDFPYNKAKRALSKFGPGEIDQLSLQLLTIYHQGHSGEVDIDLALEEWVLGL